MGYGDRRRLIDPSHKGSQVTIWHASRECASMNDLEGRLANVEHQLGRKLTPNESSLMELWYEKFKNNPNKPIPHGAQTERTAFAE